MQISNILITGGAGYIGSHMVAYLLEKGIIPVVIDNLSTGYRDAVPCHVPFFKANYADHSILKQICHMHPIDMVMHFGGSIQVAESVDDPNKYYHNNVVNTLSLLDFLVKNEIKKFIFSSTAAVYGNPQTDIITEDHPKNPITPYGSSKWMIEQILQDYAKAYNFNSVCLRYFNAAGAHPRGTLALHSQIITHLIPVLIEVAIGKRQSFAIYGTDYQTTDGSCIRDFIHVMDLVSAHWHALAYLEQGGGATAFNVGTSQGYSVRQVVNIFKQVTQTDFIVNVAAQRSGDPACLVASANKIIKQLGWTAVNSDLENIILHAWEAQRALLTNLTS